MKEQEALKILEAMPDTVFDKFFQALPLRTRLLIEGGMADWKEVCPKWYIKGVIKC